MTSPRIFRILRISAAATSLVLCAMFVVLWGRSYAWYDWLVGPLPRSHAFQASTQMGQLELLVSGPAFRLSLWELTSYPIQPDGGLSKSSQASRFDLSLVQGRLRVATPIWFPALLAGACAAIFGFRTVRFSLRTLLVAMTFVGVVLGLAVAFR